MTEDAFARQMQITWGSYFIRIFDDLTVFGYCYTPEEVLEAEERAGASLDEAEHHLEQVRLRHEYGARWGLHYSVIEPTGEYGSSHVAMCWPITKEDFDYAKDHGWMLSPVAVNRIQNEIEEMVREAGERLEGGSNEG